MCVLVGLLSMNWILCPCMTANTSKPLSSCWEIPDVQTCMASILVKELANFKLLIQIPCKRNKGKLRLSSHEENKGIKTFLALRFPLSSMRMAQWMESMLCGACCLQALPYPENSDYLLYCCLGWDFQYRPGSFLRVHSLQGHLTCTPGLNCY